MVPREIQKYAKLIGETVEEMKKKKQKQNGDQSMLSQVFTFF